MQKGLMQQWLIGATDRNRLAAMFQLYNILAAFFVFFADKGNILKIDEYKTHARGEVFPKLLHQFFHGEAKRVGGAVFFVDDDVMILRFAVENLLAKQSHFLVASLKVKARRYLDKRSIIFFRTSSNAFSVTGLSKNHIEGNLNQLSIY